MPEDLHYINLPALFLAVGLVFVLLFLWEAWDAAWRAWDKHTQNPHQYANTGHFNIKDDDGNDIDIDISKINWSRQEEILKSRINDVSDAIARARWAAYKFGLLERCEESLAKLFPKRRTVVDRETRSIICFLAGIFIIAIWIRL